MRILNISNYYYPHIGGIEQVARDICDSLKSKHDIRVFCFNGGNEIAQGTVDGVEVTRAKCFLKISSQSLSFEYGKKLKKTTSSFKPETIIFHYPNPFGAHYLLKILKKNKDIKLILWWHLDIVKQKILKLFFKKQTLRLLERAEKVIATSPNYIEGSEFLSEFKEKCAVISNCVSKEHIQTTQQHYERAALIKSEYPNKTICFALGRHTEYKGIEYLVRASKLLDDSFAVLIAGEGELTNKLKKMASDDKKVVFLGRIDNDYLKSLMIATDIFCFPSITKNEAFGIALAEAMFFEKPAVTFNIPGSGVNYVSIDGSTCKEVPNRDVDSFASAIKELSRDSNLAKTYGRNAKQRVVDLSTQDVFFNKVNSLVDGLER